MSNEKSKSLQNYLKCVIDDSKQNYYYSGLEIELLNVQRNSKLYWSIFNTFLNNNKVPIIPSLFHENERVPDFKKKAGLFNSFFAEQCSLLSKLLPFRLHYFTEKRLSAIKISRDYIFNIIQLLDPNKAHNHDMIIIQMLKTFGKSICRLLELIFNKYISNGVFLRIEKENVHAFFISNAFSPTLPQCRLTFS